MEYRRSMSAYLLLLAALQISCICWSVQGRSLGHTRSLKLSTARQSSVRRAPEGQVLPWSSRLILGSKEASQLGDAYNSTGEWGFVKTKDLHFEVNGKPFWPAGTNAFYAAQVNLYTDEQVWDLFQGHASRGATLMRVFAFSDGDGIGQIPTPEAIQPELGVYNEVALRRLDLVLAAARNAGIRLVLVFTNFEPFYGGIQWYVDQVKGPGQPKELFYTDKTVKSYYRKYVTMLTQRNNTVTGVAYRDDPTIFAWDLMNEPHTDNQYEEARGLAPGSVVLAWIKEMAPFVKKLDPNHLLATGEEGYRSRGNIDCCYNSWINTGYKGVDFDANTAVPEIDYATVHAYPDNWGVTSAQIDWYGPNFLATRARIAHAAGKPILMEEYGAKENVTSSRNVLIGYLQDAAEEYGYAGSLVWEVHDAETDNSGYVFTYDDLSDGGNAVLDQYARMRTKTLQGATYVASDEVSGAEPPEGAADSRYWKGAGQGVEGGRG